MEDSIMKLKYHHYSILISFIKTNHLLFVNNDNVSKDIHQ